MYSVLKLYLWQWREFSSLEMYALCSFSFLKRGKKSNYSGAGADTTFTGNYWYLTLTGAAVLVSSEQMCLFASDSAIHEAYAIFNNTWINPLKFIFFILKPFKRLHLSHLLLVVGAQSILMACLKHQNLRKNTNSMKFTQRLAASVTIRSDLKSNSWMNNAKLCWFPCSVWLPRRWRLRRGPSPLSCSETRRIYCQ